MGNAEGNTEELEPMLRTRPLPADVAQARADFDATAPGRDNEAQPYIDALVAVCRDSLDLLAHIHEQIAEQTDLDLESGGRWLATWELSGHAIALGYGILGQVETGSVATLRSSMRALVETLGLVMAVSGGDESLVRRWLRGKYISPKEARAAQQRFYERVLAPLNARGEPIELHPEYRARRGGLEELGLDPDAGAAGVLDEINSRVYGDLSGATHSTRSSIGPSISRHMRRFSYRRHPDAGVRLELAAEAASHIETAVLEVGTGLGEIIGLDYVRPQIVAAYQTLATVLRAVAGPA